MSKKYSISDFSRGDEVYHLTDPNQKMVVIGKNEETNEINCRWIKGEREEKRTYFVEELAKCADRSTGVRFTAIGGNRNNHY